MFSRARVKSFSKTPSEGVPAGDWAPRAQGCLQRWRQCLRPVYASAASEAASPPGSKMSIAALTAGVCCPLIFGSWKTSAVRASKCLP
jgi:hypothetical protein